MIAALTKSKIDMFGAWCAVLYLLAVLAGWGLVAGFLLPPTAPTDSAEQIAALYNADLTRIRIGMVIVMISAMLMVPFTAVAAKYIARTEGGAGLLTYTFLLGAAGNMMLTFYPAIWWLVAAFRPERAPDLIYLMNDMAWLQFIGGITMYLAMPLAVCITALADTSADPVFPRWCGFLNIWLAVIILPDQLLFFFQRGPFAWDGLFGLWLPVVGFSGFWIVNMICLRSAILRDRAAATRAQPQANI